MHREMRINRKSMIAFGDIAIASFLGESWITCEGMFTRNFYDPVRSCEAKFSHLNCIEVSHGQLFLQFTESESEFPSIKDCFEFVCNVKFLQNQIDDIDMTI